MFPSDPGVPPVAVFPPPKLQTGPTAEVGKTFDSEGREWRLTLRTYVTLGLRETPPRKGGGSSAFSFSPSGGSIPGGLVRERSGDRPDSLAASSGSVPGGPDVGAV